jgi:hypothetical protein
LGACADFMRASEWTADHGLPRKRTMFDVPDILKEFERAATDLAAFRAEMAAVIKSDIDPASRHYLQALGKTIDEALAEVRQNLPQTVEYCQTTNAETKKKMAETEARYEVMKKDADAAAAAAAVAAAPPEPIPKPEIQAENLDGSLRQYRQELLALLAGGKETDKEGKREDREIWQDWSRITDK